MFGIHLQIFLFISCVYIFSQSHCKIPDIILCADQTCTEPISEAYGNVRYTPIEKHLLPFTKGTKLTIISKTAEKDGYWGAKVGHITGFVPPNLIKEVKVFKSTSMLVNSVPSVITDQKQAKLQKNEELVEKISDPVQESKISNLNELPKDSVENQVTASNFEGSTQKFSVPLHSEKFGQAENSHQVKDVEPGSLKLESNTQPTVLDKTKVDDSNENGEDNEDDTDYDDMDDENEDDEENEESVVNAAESAINVPEQSNETMHIPSKNMEIIEPNVKESFNFTSRTDNTVKVQGEEESISTEFVNSDFKKSDETVNEKILDEVLNRNTENIILDNIKASDELLNSKNAKDEMIIGSNSDSINNNNNNNNNENNNNGEDNNNNNNNNNINNINANSWLYNRDILKMQDLHQKEPHLGDYSINNVKNTQDKSDIPEVVGVNQMEEVPLNNSTDGELYNHTANENIPLDVPISTKEEGKFIAETKVNSFSINNDATRSLHEDGKQQAEKVNDFLSTQTSKNSEVLNDGNAATKGDVAGIDGSTGINSDKGAGVSDINNNNVNNIVNEAFDLKSTLVPYAAEAAKMETVMPADNYIVENSNINSMSEGSYTPSPQTAPVDSLYTTNSLNEYSNTIPIKTENSGLSEKTENLKQSVEDFTSDLPVTTSADKESVETTQQSIGIDFNSEPSTEEPKSDQMLNEVKETTDNPSEKEDEKGFFSKISRFILSSVGLGSKTENEVELLHSNQVIDNVIESNTASHWLKEGTHGIQDESCKTSDGLDSICPENLPSKSDSAQSWNFWASAGKTPDMISSHNTFIYLVVTAATVLLFTLGYYFIEKFRNDGPLIAKINRLEQELLISAKECVILKDELTSTKEKLNLFETSSNDKIITALQTEIEESKKIKADLENQIEVLQQELEAATEAGLDLNKMLSEVLTQKGGSETLMESVENLQSQLNNQQKIIDEMTTKLITKTKENQELQDELAAANEKIESLESETEDMRSNIDVHMKDNEGVISELTAKNNELQIKFNQLNEKKEKDVANFKKNIEELERKFKTASDTLKIKEGELNNLKDSVKKIRLKDSKNIDSLFDVSRIKAELTQSQSEVTSLKEFLKREEEKRINSDNNMEKMRDEMKKIKEDSQIAEKEKLEAQTRLEVLSNYFREKETQLQKELGLREAILVQKQGDDSTIYEKMQSLEEEINNYKSQNETLRKEILDQERGLKSQIATLEKKAHENWIAARQAERKLEEHKQEASQLRNKLTLMEKNINNELEANPHHRANEEVNGSDTLSPLLHDASSPILFPPPLPLDPNNSSLIPPGFIPPPMFMPPPPGGFMPPPPPFLPGDHRPPPLGRMSSPPLNNRFSPPPPEYAYDRMSTPPLSPSNRNYRSPNESDRDRFRHRTPTSPSFRSRNWEEGVSGFRPITSERERRDHKGGSNLSSGHSSESLDKGIRHSGRV